MIHKNNITTFLVFVCFLLLVGCAQVPDGISTATITNQTDSVDRKDMMNSSFEIKALDQSLSSFEFEGYAIGKSHVGTFDIGGGSLVYNGNILVGANGVIDAASVNTGIAGLDKHLRADDFFDVEQFPSIEVVATTVSYDEATGNGTISGTIKFHGVTKDVTFPVVVFETGVSADFLLDTTPFGMTNLGVKNEVRIAFSLVTE